MDETPKHMTYAIPAGALIEALPDGRLMVARVGMPLCVIDLTTDSVTVVHEPAGMIQ